MRAVSENQQLSGIVGIDVRKVIRTQFSAEEEKRLRQTFAELLRKRDTWSGKTIWWPIEGVDDPSIVGWVAGDGLGLLRFSYGAAGEVLRGLSIDVPAGETHAIVGATGAGKSTVVKLLALLVSDALSAGRAAPRDGSRWCGAARQRGPLA
mgnify:CR=1 FL=1